MGRGRDQTPSPFHLVGAVLTGPPDCVWLGLRAALSDTYKGRMTDPHERECEMSAANEDKDDCLREIRGCSVIGVSIDRAL